jgi:predicted ferric reductase
MSGTDSGGNTERTPASRHRLLRGLHPLLLVAAYVAIVLMPLVLALIQGRPARGLFRELSSGLVMVGFAMLLVQFLLSGRFRAISGRVGIDLTMRFHQLAALTVLVFVLAHPFLYAAPRLSPDPMNALASLSRMFSSEGLRSGVVAWWLLLILVPAAIFRDRLPISYEAWRLSHGIGSALIAILSTHHTLRVGTYSAEPWLAGFWLLMTAVALLSLVEVYILKPIRQRRCRYRVASNRQVAERMWEIVVEPERGPAMGFAPGQFVWLKLGHSPFSVTEHPFSISSAPSERPQMAFTIKASGDFTDRIGEVPVGTTAYLDGPHGTFTTLPYEGCPLVFIAGGVGFAPIVGMLRDLRAKHFSKPVRLIYGNRVETQILYRAELEALERDLNLTVHLVLSEPPREWCGKSGELSADIIRSCLEPLPPRETAYFVCGPTPMMNGVERTLIELGVPARRIVSERFRYN